MSSGYRKLLARADEHFQNVVRTQADQLQCRAGCTLCCYGLFEIGAADVVVIADALSALDPATRTRLETRARNVMEATAHPESLRDSSDTEREEFFARASSVPCPALADDGRCSIYDSRPLVCRTFGLPLRNGAQMLGEVCELNFNSASDADQEKAAWDLQWEDILGEEDQYTVPEAIMIAMRQRG